MDHGYQCHWDNEYRRVNENIDCHVHVTRAVNPGAVSVGEVLANLRPARDELEDNVA